MRGPSRLDDDWEEPANFRTKQAHGQVIIDRLVLLLRAGYRIDIERIQEGLGIPLKHPNRKAPDIELGDDGLINDQAPSHFRGRPDHERTLYEPEDVSGFASFVARVPRPDWFEKMRISTVEKAFSMAATAAILVGFFALCGWIGESVWDWLRGAFP